MKLLVAPDSLPCQTTAPLIDVLRHLFPFRPGNDSHQRLFPRNSQARSYHEGIVGGSEGRAYETCQFVFGLRFHVLGRFPQLAHWVKK